ncbi:MAG: hypothetical protein KKA31_00590 [Candidatus Margulisbacteria bacterium]|nr:hypothetical protein [Candidatus Margulisiibacteriota bacterium]
MALSLLKSVAPSGLSRSTFRRFLGRKKTPLLQDLTCNEGLSWIKLKNGSRIYGDNKAILDTLNKNKAKLTGGFDKLCETIAELLPEGEFTICLVTFQDLFNSKEIFVCSPRSPRRLSMKEIIELEVPGVSESSSPRTRNRTDWDNDMHPDSVLAQNLTKLDQEHLLVLPDGKLFLL